MERCPICGDLLEQENEGFYYCANLRGCETHKGEESTQHQWHNVRFTSAMLEQARDREAAARTMLIRLVTKLDAVHKDPAYVAVWTLAQSHLGFYKGATYTKELDDARALLDPPAPKCGTCGGRGFVPPEGLPNGRDEQDESIPCPDCKGGA